MWLGWDGCHKVQLTENNLNYYRAIEEETGFDVVRKVYGQETTEDGRVLYDAKLDSYTSNGFLYMTLSQEQYDALQAWQNETGIQVIYPAIKTKNVSDANIWYEANQKGVATLDRNGNFVAVYKTSGNDGNSQPSHWRCFVFGRSLVYVRYVVSVRLLEYVVSQKIGATIA